MEISESQIISNCQKDQLEDFALLYDAYNKKIYEFLYFRTHHKETAEDLLSVTFTKALENIGKFDRRKAQFSTWLYQIARNTLFDHYRTFKGTSGIEDAWDIPDGGNIQRDLEMKDKLEEVRRFLKTLPQQQRDIIVMRVWDGLSYKEIAEILNVSEASAKMSFSRSLAKINKNLAVAIVLITLVLS